MKKYVSVLLDIELKIREGQYRSGYKLPSVRDASELYKCSKSTILRAYAELERKHAIYSIPQSGYYVVENPSDVHHSHISDYVDFASASPDLNVFPYLDFQHCLNQAIDTYKYHLFTYGDSQGLETLRHTLVSHLADTQVFAKTDRIIVTSGVQQALEILAKMPFPNAKKRFWSSSPATIFICVFWRKRAYPSMRLHGQRKV